MRNTRVSSLLEQAIARQRPVGPECGVVKAKKTRPELAGQIQELIDHLMSGAVPRISFTTASELLEEQKVHVPDSTLSRHVRGKCGCPR